MSKNISAVLQAIRLGEGTSSPDGYNTIFGGKHFHSYDDHPNIKVKAGKYVSTASGAYQILYRTWKEVQKALGLKDFSPASQDAAAIYLIKRRGALDEIVAGKIEQAVRLCNREWASLPESPYGQPTVSMSDFIAYYKSKGGAVA